MVPDSLRYDSTYNPPRISVDTLVLRGKGGVNGLWFEGDTCWSFIQDDEGDIPAELLEVNEAKVFFDGDSIEAVSLDPLPCRDSNYDPDNPLYISFLEPAYFSTADGIGPVAYYHTSPDNLMDAYWYEFWTLIAANVNETSIRSFFNKGIPENRRCFISDNNLVIELERKQRLSVEMFLPDGKKAGDIFPEKSVSAGRHIFDIGGIRNANGIYVIHAGIEDFEKSFIVHSGK
jgi:hypothetical protein